MSAGDSDAFTALDERHRAALTRYAGTLLRRSNHDAEDVVQDVLIRAHEALRAGDVPDALRPWLYRLTRNRAIDEVRRKRWGADSLDGDHGFASDARDEPDSALRRKQAMGHLVEDIAGLPARQREALLARELDGYAPDEVAARLGVSVTAAQKLVMRARQNLVKSRDARDADCELIRVFLRDSHERGVRASEHSLRHVKGCESCREYRARHRADRNDPRRNWELESGVRAAAPPQSCWPPWSPPASAANVPSRKHTAITKDRT